MSPLDGNVSAEGLTGIDLDDLSGIPPAIAFTVFLDEFAQHKTDLQADTVEDLAARLSEPTAKGKTGLPWIKLLVFGETQTRKRCLRHDANVVAITGCEGDYDAKPKADGSLMAIEEAARLIKGAGIEAVIFQTPSSIPDKPHWRILCPTWHEYRGDDLKAQRAKLLARVNGALGGVLAGESFNLSQSFYFGNIKGRPPIKPIIVRGRRIDLLDGLDAGAVYKNGSNQPEAPREPVAAPEGLVESDDDQALLKEIHYQVRLAAARDGIGKTPTGQRGFKLVTWLLKIRVADKIIEPAALQAILAEQGRDVADDLVENALAAIGSERGSVDIEPAELPSVTFGHVTRLHQALAARDPSLMQKDDVMGYEPQPDNDQTLPLILAGSAKGKAMLDKLIADLGGVAPERRNRFGGRTPEADATLPPMTYWDNDQTLPRGPFVGLAVGEQGSHKTGLFIKHGLDAIERHGAHVLYLAAEGAHGIKTARLPKAREARNMPWAKLNDGWRTEAEPFGLLSAADHDLLFAAYGGWAPNLILVDVLTKVSAGADINTPATGSAIMTAAQSLALRFNATVLIAHHPGKDASKGAMGSALFGALADFMWSVSTKSDRAWVTVEKMKDGPADRSVGYAVEINGPPVIRDLKVSEIMAERAAAANPVAVAIKALLDKDAVYDMGGLVEALVANSGLPFGIKAPHKLIASLCNEGELSGFVEVRGTGKNKRYTFKKID